MKLYFHYCLGSFCNCYVAAQDSVDGLGKGQAIIVDPGTVDENIINLLEDSGYELKAALLTHDHLTHTYGLHCLKRIYDFEIFAATPLVRGYKANLVKDGEVFDAGPFSIKVISVPGHSADSVVYMIDNLLFTGDALTAGIIGVTTNSYGSMQQSAALENKVFTLRGNYVVLPGHGPPSSLTAERRYNAGIKKYHLKKPGRERNHSLIIDMME
jgi:glyoxylase-like metal-dependent hydrolase (beta-lactamase superfamily II)